MTPIQEAIDQSDLVFLATPFQVNQSILDGLRFNGKTLVDCTNPVEAGITLGLKSLYIHLLFSEYLAIHIIVKKRRRSEEEAKSEGRGSSKSQYLSLKTITPHICSTFT